MILAPKKVYSNTNASCAKLFTRVSRQVVQPVLAEGLRGDRATITLNKNQLVVKSSEGDYRFQLRNGEVYPGPPVVSRTSKGKWRSLIFLNPTWLSSETGVRTLQDQLRSAFRADTQLHPHLRPVDLVDDVGSVLSQPQNEAIEALLKMAPKTPSKASAWLGLVMPPGMGKTTTSCHYLIKQGLKYNGKPGWKKRPKVLFVVENKLILQSAVDTYARELGFDKVAQVYGVDADQIDDDAEMIGITRSSYHARIDLIHELLRSDPGQPWFIVMDEAHHLGKNDGQFNAILEDLSSNMDHRHLGLTLSATLWHEDSELVERLLEGKVYGPLLNPEELIQLQNGRNLPELTRIQTLRAMQRGYLTAMNSLSIITEIDGSSAARHFDTSISYSDPAGRHMAEIIKAKRILNVPDRGAIFFRTTDQANEYAKKLSGRNYLDTQVRPLHGKMSDTQIQDTMDWIRNKGSYDSKIQRKTHKYITVVSMLNEGTDIPELNLVTIAKTYSKSAAGFKALIQNVGRGTRPGTEGLRLIDYSGFSKILIDTAHFVMPLNSGQSDDFDLSNHPRPTIEINDQVVFVEEVLQIHFDSLSFHEQYPFFDPDGFVGREGGLKVLYEYSRILGVANFHDKFGARDTLLALAQHLPDDQGRSLLIQSLESISWTASDAHSAFANIASSQERIFKGLILIFKAFKKQYKGLSIDEEDLNTAIGTQQLLSEILDRPLVELSESTRNIFQSEKGGLKELVKLAREEGTLPYASKFGVKRLFERLSHYLKDGEVRLKFLMHLEGIAWASQDGGNAITGTLKAQDKVFQALVFLQFAFARSTGLSTGSIDDITKASGVRKLYNSLRGISSLGLTEDERLIFTSESGGMRKFAENAKRFGINSYSQKHGARNLFLAIALQLEDSPQRNHLLNELNKISWTASDGSNAVNGTRAAQDRIFTGIVLLAETLNQIDPEHKVDITQLHTAEEVSHLMTLCCP